MTTSLKPDLSVDHHGMPFRQSTSRGFLKKHRYLWAGFVMAAASALILLSIVSMQGERPHSADRARVTVNEATIVGLLVQHNIPTATVLLKNIGRSPALTTRARLVMTVWTSNRFPDWDMPLKLTADTENIGNLGPGSTISKTVSLLTPLTDVQGMHLERKDWFIVTLGIVSYVDVLGARHETRLCLIWRDTSTQYLSPCEKWNEVE
jgi:hypothetical protein